MQVLCVASNNEPAAVVCPACGQSFSVYYSRQFASECEIALDAVRTTLLEHHGNDATAAAHPAEPFNVPAWSGAAHMSAAALLSGAPLGRMMAGAATRRLIS